MESEENAYNEEDAYYVEEKDILDNLNEIKSHLSSLNKTIPQILKEIKSEINNLFEIIQYNQNQMNNYFNNLQSSFYEEKNILSKNLEELKKMTDILDEGFKTTINLQKETHMFINEFKSANSNLLTNVTTGIALTELLKSAFISDESETSIERAVEENENRFVETLKSIEEKKQLYDKYIENLFVSFFKQIKQIANHILEIQYNIFNNLDVITYIDKEALTHIIEADDIRTENRQKKFDELYNSLNDKSFENLSSIREKIEEELSVKNILHTYSTKGIDKIPVFALPITIIESNEWKNQQKTFIDYYGLNEPVGNCYENIKLKDVFLRYKNYLESLVKSGDFEIDTSETLNKFDILSGLEELYNKGYLINEHYFLVKKHLELYPIYKMELRR